MVDVNVVRGPANKAARCAITVIEVLFAMMVAIVGLLGIASLLPLAARNAREANGYNFVQGAAQNWYQEFTTRGMNNYGAWRAVQDYKTAANPQFVSMAHVALITPTYSTVTSQQINRVWTQQAICLDPYFFTDAGVQAELASAIANSSTTNPFPANVGAYRPAVFPYYQDGYNPLTDAFSPSAAWEDQPRMVRVTLDAPMLPVSTLRQVDRQFAQMLFTSGDDFAAYVDEKQAEIPATRIFSIGSGVPGFTKATSDRKYSWMATLSPREPRVITAATATAIESEYSLSIAIFNNRNMVWLDPNDVSPGIVENKPSGERLVWVYPLSGDFVGGNGGRVRLISNSKVDDRLHIGDWIMLGKHYADFPAGSMNRYAYFRWYRIVATDAEPQQGRLDVDRDGDGVGEIVNSRVDPYGNAGSQEVWSRDVVLEGPDWSFTSLGIRPTTGTLMNNVITVIDRSTIIP